SRAAQASERSYSGAGWLPLRTTLAMTILLRQFLHRGRERLAALLVVAKHVEARARGLEQHRIAGARNFRRALHGLLNGFCFLKGYFVLRQNPRKSGGAPAH